MDIYDEMISASQRIAAAFPHPRFYEACAPELARSMRIFEQTPLVARCLRAVRQDLARNEGHGLDHAMKVSVEAGALVLAEGARIGLDQSGASEAAALALMAGLLHDMRRTEKDHAKSGAEAAGVLCRAFGMTEKDKQCVIRAIANHEAFAEPPARVSAVARLVSDALYDADKFRWGPDNFTVTLWEMLRFRRASVAGLIPKFQEGMAGIERIKATFRTHTGSTFGPEFIDLGLAMGEKIYEFLKERFEREPE